MADRVIVESYEGHTRRKLILWLIPIVFILVSFADFKELYPMFLIGIVWLGLLIYFKLIKKK